MPSAPAIRSFKRKYGRKYKIYPITAVSAEGLDALLDGIFETLSTLPPVEPIRPDEEFTYTDRGDNTQYEITKLDAGVYEVTGGLVIMLCRNVELDDPNSMAYFQKILRVQGVIKSLQEAGCKEGDTVLVGDVEFDFVL